MRDDAIQPPRDPRRPSSGLLLIFCTAALAVACQDDSAGAVGTDAIALDNGATDSALDVPTPNDSGVEVGADVAVDAADVGSDSAADSGVDAAPDPDVASDSERDDDAGDAVTDEGTDAGLDLADEDVTTDGGLPDVTPLECFADVDPCPDGTNCFCGGPGPIGTCFCGQECETAQDCQDSARPVCCGDTCTSSCECFCD